jgi:proline iminopeptidase
MKINLSLLLLILSFSITGICQEDGLIKTEDGVIHYRKYGSGEPLLIINGGPGLDCEGFVPLAKLLSDKYMAILFDQRGTGKSELKQVDSTTITMDLMAKDIETIRKYFKIDKWIVLGHSFGGWMAEYYATKYPESIKAMILSSSGGIDLNILNYFTANLRIRLSQTERDSLDYYSEKLKQGDTTYYVRYNWAKYLATGYVYNKKYVPSIAKRLAFARNPRITDLVYKDLYKMNFDCKETLRDFDKPVLIIQGRQDLTGDGIAYEAHAVLKNSIIKFINKSVHYSWLEQGEEYKSDVEKFISSVDVL